jgi:hypothetical protein
VQKYEKGTNRISAGTLHELSRFFDTPVQFFFDGMDGAVRRSNSKGAAALHPLTRFGTTSDGMKIVTAFDKADPSLRRILASSESSLLFAVWPFLQDAGALPDRQSCPGTLLGIGGELALCPIEVIASVQKP